MNSLYETNYETVIQHLPVLQENKSLFNLFLYLNVAPVYDKDSFNIRVGQRTLAKLEGKLKELKSKDYVAEHILKEFNDKVYPIQWSKWSSKDELERTVWNKNDIPAWIEEISLRELFTKYFPDERRRYTSGRLITNATKKKKLIDYREEINTYSPKPKTETIKKLIDYMNNLPVKGFSDIQLHMDEAIKYAKNIQVEDRHKIRNAKLLQMQQLAILAQIREEPLQLYEAVENSVRIYPANQHVASVDRNIRHILTQGWMESDLSSAQLAIAAKVWEIPSVQQFLQEGGKIWRVLMELYKNTVSKDFLKHEMYHLMYGGTEYNIRDNFGERGINPDPFLTYPLIQDILDARGGMFRFIKEIGGIHDAFGNWISLEGRDRKSVLAELNQSFEMKLLEPVIQYALNDGFDLKILLFQHDGFSWKTEKMDEEHIEAIKNKITLLTKIRAMESGIITHLETEKVTSPQN